jgi:hypothetical protein
VVSVGCGIGLLASLPVVPHRAIVADKLHLATCASSPQLLLPSRTLQLHVFVL